MGFLVRQHVFIATSDEQAASVLYTGPGESVVCDPGFVGLVVLEAILTYGLTSTSVRSSSSGCADTGLVIGERETSGPTVFGWGADEQTSVPAIRTTVVDSVP